MKAHVNKGKNPAQTSSTLISGRARSRLKNGNKSSLRTNEKITDINITVGCSTKAHESLRR